YPHAQYVVGRTRAIAIAAMALLATLGAMQARMGVIDEGIVVAAGDRVGGGASCAVTAVRAAERNEFFATETGGATAALAGDDFNGGFVNEFHDVVCGPGRRSSRVKRALSCVAAERPPLLAGVAISILKQSGIQVEQGLTRE